MLADCGVSEHFLPRTGLEWRFSLAGDLSVSVFCHSPYVIPLGCLCFACATTLRLTLLAVSRLSFSWLVALLTRVWFELLIQRDRSVTVTRVTMG